MDPLAPLRPSAELPFDAAAAAHLARRAGFGVPPEQALELARLGVDDAVSALVDFPDEEPELEQEIARLGSALAVDAGAEELGAHEAVQRMRRWWLFRLVRSRHPLREKLTLFWHDHFACQETIVVRAPLLLNQNRRFRRHAAGPFRALLLEIARDAAMLVFLDNRLSEKENPNENWARELMELFTLGVNRYAQRDVTELARVFTGWTTPHKNAPEFLFDPELHDSGDKVVLGREIRGRAGAEGLEEGVEAIDVLLAQDACAEFLARKLLHRFAREELDGEEDAAVVAALAQVLRAHALSPREALRALFRSAWFYRPAQRFCLHKNPVDLAVGTARLLGMQNPHLAGLDDLVRRLGLNLFQPPSVAGFPRGREWIHSGSAVHRMHFALEVAQLPHSPREVAGRPAIDLDRLPGELPAAADHATLVRAVASRLLERPLAPEHEAVLVAYLVDADQRLAPSDPPQRRRRAQVRGLLHLLLTFPEYVFA